MKIFSHIAMKRDSDTIGALLGGKKGDSRIISQT
jgi:hypothetical protein